MFPGGAAGKIVVIILQLLRMMIQDHYCFILKFLLKTFCVAGMVAPARRCGLFVGMVVPGSIAYNW